MPHSSARLQTTVGMVGLVGLAMAFGGVTSCVGNLDPVFLKADGFGGGPGEPTGLGGAGGGAVCNAPALMVGKCTVGCHSPASALNAGLDLSSDNVAERLLNKTSNGSGASTCGFSTTPYLIPGSNPADGLLIDKVRNVQPECGAQMPWVNPAAWSADDTACLIDWATSVTAP